MTTLKNYFEDLKEASKKYVKQIEQLEKETEAFKKHVATQRPLLNAEGHQQMQRELANIERENAEAKENVLKAYQNEVQAVRKKVLDKTKAHYQINADTIENNVIELIKVDAYTPTELINLYSDYIENKNVAMARVLKNTLNNNVRIFENNEQEKTVKNLNLSLVMLEKREDVDLFDFFEKIYFRQVSPEDYLRRSGQVLEERYGNALFEQADRIKVD